MAYSDVYWSMDALATVGIITLGALLAGLALAFVRVRVWLRYGSDSKQVKVMFGGIALLDTFARGGESRPETHSKRRRNQKKKQEGKAIPTSSRRWSEICRLAAVIPALLKAVLIYTVQVARKTSLRGVECAISGGLADPADTGMAFGALSALAGAAPGLGEKLRLEPDYLAERIEYDLRGEISLRPISLLAPTVRLISGLPKRELLGIIRDNRKRRRKVAKKAG